MAEDMTEQIKALISEAVPEILHLDIQDVSGGCGAKFELVVVSDSFEGVGRLPRQRMINECLKPVMSEIHAITMKCWTIAEAEKKRAAAEAATEE